MFTLPFIFFPLQGRMGHGRSRHRNASSQVQYGEHADNSQPQYRQHMQSQRNDSGQPQGASFSRSQTQRSDSAPYNPDIYLDRPGQSTRRLNTQRDKANYNSILSNNRVLLYIQDINRANEYFQGFLFENFEESFYSGKSYGVHIAGWESYIERLQRMSNFDDVAIHQLSSLGKEILPPGEKFRRIEHIHRVSGVRTQLTIVFAARTTPNAVSVCYVILDMTAVPRFADFNTSEFARHRETYMKYKAWTVFQKLVGFEIINYSEAQSATSTHMLNNLDGRHFSQWSIQAYG